MTEHTSTWEPTRSLRCRIFGHSLREVHEDYPNLEIRITHRCRRCSFGKGKGLLWASLVSEAAIKKAKGQ